MKKTIITLLLLLGATFAQAQFVGVSPSVGFVPQKMLDVDGDAHVSGQLGIGVLSPSHKLHVGGGARVTQGFIANDGTANTPSFRFNSGGSMGMFRAAANQLAFSTASTERLRILADGNVGIGTPAPESKLEVISTTPGELETAVLGSSVPVDAQGIGVVGIGGYSGVQGNVFPTGNELYFGAAGNVISSAGAGTNIGIYGRAEGGATNYAGYFLGDVLVSGLSGGGVKGVAADNNGLLRTTNGIGTAPITSCGPFGTCNAGTSSISGSDLTFPETSVTINCLPAGINISGISLSVTISGTSCPSWSYLEYWNGSGWIYLGCNGTYNITEFNGAGNGTSIRVRGRDNPSDGISDFITVSITGITVSYSSPCTTQFLMQRIIRGNVNANTTISAGGGFICTRPSTGIYLVTFSQAFSDVPTVVATQIGSGDTRDNALVYDITSTSFRVKVGDSGGNVSNRPFSFIIIGSE